MTIAERRGIISAGTWALDRLKLIDTWPQEEHLARIIDTDMQGGGSGHNLGVDIRSLDPSLPVEAIGLVGTDSDGDFLIDKATAAGIDVTQLHRSGDERTSYTDVMSDSDSGKRTFFHYPGTSDLLSPGHFDFGHCNGKLLHLGLLGVHKTMDNQWLEFENGWVAVLAAAKEHGIATNLELVSIAEPLIRELALPCLPYVDSLIINEYELSALADMPIADSDGINADKCINAASSLFELGAMSLVVVHYPQGAVAVDVSGSTIVKESFDVHPSWVLSAVGAGDAFAAGMLYGMHENWTLAASLELGHAVAAASLRSSSTVGSVETVEQCLSFARNASKSQPRE